MKHILSILILILLLTKSGFAQEANGKAKISIVKIETTMNEKIRGILYAVGDSSLRLYCDSTGISRLRLEAITNFVTISSSNIQRIKIHKRSAGFTGAMVGGCLGLATGIVIDDYQANGLGIA